MLQGGRLFKMGAYLRVGAKSSIHGIYYIQKEECTQVKPGCEAWFSLIVIKIIERYSNSAQSTMTNHVSVKSSVVNNVMKNVKLLK